jgi:hypothetical protein
MAIFKVMTPDVAARAAAAGKAAACIASVSEHLEAIDVGDLYADTAVPDVFICARHWLVRQAHQLAEAQAHVRTLRQDLTAAELEVLAAQAPEATVGPPPWTVRQERREQLVGDVRRLLEVVDRIIEATEPGPGPYEISPEDLMTLFEAARSARQATEVLRQP